MRLYLSSFRIGDHPDRLLELTGSNRRTAVVANAIDHLPADDRRTRVAADLVALREIGLDAVELDLRRFVGAQDALREALIGVELVWLRGGNVFVLRHRLAETGLDLQLIDGLAADRFVVGGYSAGTCVLGVSLAGLEDCDPIADLAQITLGAEPIMAGLGVIDATVVPHLDSPEHPESAVLTSIAAKLRATERPIIELRDGDVLIVSGATRTLLPRSFAIPATHVADFPGLADTVAGGDRHGTRTEQRERAGGRGGVVTTEMFDRDCWERRWAQALREHADVVARRPPNVHLLAEAGDLRPGLALDAGCGHGAETLWLAAHGWRVTAVDFAATALDHARLSAEAVGTDVAERVDWVQGDLATWTPPPGQYHLVICLYVHMAGTMEETVRRLAAGVAPGGTLLLVGHRPIDPTTGNATAAAGQVQISVNAAVAALDPSEWDIVVAEDRPRAAAGTGVDAVVHARRLP